MKNWNFALFGSFSGERFIKWWFSKRVGSFPCSLRFLYHRFWDSRPLASKRRDDPPRFVRNCYSWKTEKKTWKRFRLNQVWASFWAWLPAVSSFLPPLFRFDAFRSSSLSRFISGWEAADTLGEVGAKKQHSWAYNDSSSAATTGRSLRFLSAITRAQPRTLWAVVNMLSSRRTPQRLECASRLVWGCHEKSFYGTLFGGYVVQKCWGGNESQVWLELTSGYAPYAAFR